MPSNLSQDAAPCSLIDVGMTHGDHHNQRHGQPLLRHAPNPRCAAFGDKIMLQADFPTAALSCAPEIEPLLPGYHSRALPSHGEA